MRRTLLALVAAVAASLGAASVARADTPVATGFYSSYNQIRVVGDLAYVAASPGLIVYDVSDRSAPRELSHLFLDRSGSFLVEVSGHYAYVLSGAIVLEHSILRVVDVADPAAPRVVGEYADLADARVQGLAVVSPTTIAIANGGAVDLVDVSDPANPVKSGSAQVTPDPGQIVGLGANGSVVYAPWQGIDENGSPFNGFTTVDASDPTAPAILDSFDLGAETLPYSVANVGSVVYVGQTPSATVVLDASDPAAIAKIGQFDYVPAPHANVFARGNRLFAATGDTQTNGLNNVRVYDVSTPENPKLLQTVSLSCTAIGMDYDPATSTAYMPCADATGSGMSTFAVAASGALDPAATVLVPEVNAVATSGDVTFLGASTTLVAARVGSGGGVDVVGSVDLGQIAHAMQVVGDRIYVLTSDSAVGANGRVRIVDASDPAALAEIGSIDLDGAGYLVTSKRFFVVGTTLYLGTPTGLDVYDVTDGANPAKVGSASLPGPVQGVVVDGTTAYVAVLRVVDFIQQADVYTIKVKKPAKPKVLKKLVNADHVSYVNDMLVADGRLYMAVAGGGGPDPVAGDGRLVVLDVTKAKPKKLSNVYTSPSFNGYAFGLQLDGDTLYVADGLDGVSVLDVGGTGDPQYVRAIDTPGFARGISLADGRLSVADESSFQVYSTAAPQ